MSARPSWRKPQPLTHVKITTTGGTTVLGRKETVHVGIGHSIIGTRAEGCQILEFKPDFHLTLEQVHQILLRHNTEYQTAFYQLHEKTADGRIVTKLRLFLERALAKKGINVGKLNDEAEKRKAVELIHAHLKHYENQVESIIPNVLRKSRTRNGAIVFDTLSRSVTSISDWLEGKIVAPNEQVMRVLAKMAPNEFEEIYGPANRIRATRRHDLGTVPWAHNYWATAHAALLRMQDRLAEGKPLTGELSGASNHVFSQLMQPVWNPVEGAGLPTKLGFTTVLQLNLATRKQAKENSRKTNGLLAGVVPSTKLAGTKIETATGLRYEHNWTATHRGSVFLARLLAKLLPKIKVTDIKGNPQTLSGGTTTLILEQPNTEFNDGKPFSFGEETPIRLSAAELLQVKQKTLHMLTSGKLDAQHGLPQGTSLRIYQECLKRAYSLPYGEDNKELQRSTLDRKRILESLMAERQLNLTTSRRVPTARTLELRNEARKATTVIEALASRIRSTGIRTVGNDEESTNPKSLNGLFTEVLGHSSPPPTPAEAWRALQEAGITKAGTTERLLGMYGHEMLGTRTTKPPETPTGKRPSK